MSTRPRSTPWFRTFALDESNAECLRGYRPYGVQGGSTTTASPACASGVLRRLPPRLHHRSHSGSGPGGALGSGELGPLSRACATEESPEERFVGCLAEQVDVRRTHQSDLIVP